MWPTPDGTVYPGAECAAICRVPPRCPAVHVTPGFCLLLAWFAAANGWNALLSVLCAAAVHETGHLLALSLWGGTVRGVSVSVFGAAMDIDSARLSYGAELSCVLAGPAANLVLSVLAARLGWYALAGASAVLCLWNLLPVRPLDGGRALELSVSSLAGPRAGDGAARLFGIASGGLLSLFAAYLMFRTGGTLWLLPPFAGLSLSVLRELGVTGREERIKKRRTLPV